MLPYEAIYLPAENEYISTHNVHRRALMGNHSHSLTRAFRKGEKSISGNENHADYFEIKPHSFRF